MAKRVESVFVRECQRRIRAVGYTDVPLHLGGVGARVTLRILAEPASKANSRKLVTMKRGRGSARRKMPTLIKSAKARTFMYIAQLAARAAYKGKPLEGRLRVAVTICYTSLLPDLDESVVLDAMQGIVYVNDRQIVERHCTRWHGSRPWVQVTVEEINNKIE